MRAFFVQAKDGKNRLLLFDLAQHSTGLRKRLKQRAMESRGLSFERLVQSYVQLHDADRRSDSTVAL